MSRMKVNEITEGPGSDIDNIIDTYKESKDQENKLKKDNEKLNSDIKQYFMDNILFNEDGKAVHSTSKYTATLSKDEVVSFDEELLLNTVLDAGLSDDDLNSVVKTKVYVDEDYLEKLVYTGKISAELLAPCRVVKEPKYTLRISKLKEKK